MFTGLIQTVGQLAERSGSSIWVAFDSAWPNDPISPGESIAIDGCCLTVAEMNPSQLRFDLSEETLARTTLGSTRPDQQLNLERALRLNDRLGGHIVQGHVDCVGTIVERSNAHGSQLFDIEVPSEFVLLLVNKGSICVGGISLTIVEPQGNRFRCAIIPHTLENTNLNDRKVGDFVNVEFDILAKTIKRLSEPYLNQI